MRKWTDAFCEGNGAAVTALSTEDFILLPQSSPTLTKKPGEGSCLCQFIIAFVTVYYLSPVQIAAPAHMAILGLWWGKTRVPM